MVFPTKIATRSVKCHGQWVTVEVREPRKNFCPERVPGDFYSKYKIRDRDFLSVGVDLDDAGLSPAEEGTLVRDLLPKAGFVVVIDVLCGRIEASPDNLVCLPARDLRSDPQKADMTFFRRRCRYDVLRVINERLTQPAGNLSISPTDVMDSQLLTRLYETEDVVSAMEYWHKENILINPEFGPTWTVNELVDEKVSRLIGGYDWEEAVASPDKAPVQQADAQTDVFICHASEDKDDFVRPLAQALKKHDVGVWYDELSLKLGDSLRQSIDAGLAKARYGIVVLSKAFFAKEWPQRELDGLVQKEVSGGNKVILPIWHGVTREEVEGYSLPLAGRVAVTSDSGLEKVVSSIIKVVKPPSP